MTDDGFMKGRPFQGIKQSRWFRDNIVGAKLTDKRIAYYEETGWYAPEAKAARKARAERKKKLKRSGSFLIDEDGHMIYDPQ